MDAIWHLKRGLKEAKGVFFQYLSESIPLGFSIPMNQPVPILNYSLLYYSKLLRKLDSAGISKKFFEQGSIHISE